MRSDTRTSLPTCLRASVCLRVTPSSSASAGTHKFESRTCPFPFLSFSQPGPSCTSYGLSAAFRCFCLPYPRPISDAQCVTSPSFILSLPGSHRKLCVCVGCYAGLRVGCHTVIRGSNVSPGFGSYMGVIPSTVGHAQGDGWAKHKGWSGKVYDLVPLVQRSCYQRCAGHEDLDAPPFI
jgi:hypothetical protein